MEIGVAIGAFVLVLIGSRIFCARRSATLTGRAVSKAIGGGLGGGYFSDRPGMIRTPWRIGKNPRL